MKKGNFGETLRREREMRGVTLEEISSATRISARNLEALEKEQWDQLPGGVFNRGFIRSISRYLGLDEEVLVAEYVVATDDQPQMAVWADKIEAKKKAAFPWIAILVIVLVLVGALFLWLQWPALKAAFTRTSTSPPAVAQDPVTPAKTPAAPPAAAKPPLTSVAEPETLELKIDAAKPTTLKIVADGQTAFDGKIAARESRKFRAKEKFEISIQDSFAVLMELNGQAMAPMGQPGEPGKITLTRKDLKKPEGQD